MKKNGLCFLSLFLLFYFGAACFSRAMDSDEIIRLKKAGFSEATIQLLIKEKSLETCAVTVDEVLNLKKAGLSEETIRLAIKESSFMKNREPVIYGTNTRPVRLSTAQDLIGLKNAGFSEEVIKAIIICEAKEGTDSERREAWEMLRSMGIIIDTGQHRDKGENR